MSVSGRRPAGTTERGRRTPGAVASPGSTPASWGPPAPWSVLLLALGLAACGGDGAGALAGPDAADPRTPDSASGPRGGDASASPAITALSPDPLLEGETATISGSGFAPAAAGNAVSVDGREADVVAATATELRIRIPSFPCVPPREVSLRVSTQGGTGSRTALLAPSEPDLSLSVGEQHLVRAGEEPCLRFPATARSEAYVVGVQSVSESPSGLTPVTIVGTAGERPAGAVVGAAGEAAGAVLGAAGEAAAGSRGADASSVPAADGAGGAGRGLPLSPTREAHLTAESRIRGWETERLLGAGPSAGIPPATRRLHAAAGGRAPGEGRAGDAGPGGIRTLVADRSLRISDTVRVRVPEVRTGMCEDYAEVEVVVRDVGERSIWLEDVDNPSGGFGPADYRAFRDLVDRDVWEHEAGYFGAPTDLDGNGRVAVVVTGRLNRMDPGLQGFVFAGDLYDRADCPSSDAGEVFYAKAPDPAGALGPAWSVADARAVTPVVLVHELAHLIQMGRRIRAGLPPMETWMMEAQATLAEEVVGHAVAGRAPGRDYGFGIAFNAGGSDSADWYRSAFVDLAHYFGFEPSNAGIEGAPDRCGWLGADPSPCHGRALWYGVGWSFLRWVSDLHGPEWPGGEAGLQAALVEDPRTGFEAVSALVGSSRAELLARWSAALYADGRVPGLGPELSFGSWNLYEIFDLHLLESALLRPPQRAFGDFREERSVRAASTAYLRLEGEGRPATTLRVEAPGGGPPPEDVQVWVMRLR